MSIFKILFLSAAVFVGSQSSYAAGLVSAECANFSGKYEEATGLVSIFDQEGCRIIKNTNSNAPGVQFVMIIDGNSHPIPNSRNVYSAKWISYNTLQVMMQVVRSSGEVMMVTSLTEKLSNGNLKVTMKIPNYPDQVTYLIQRL